MARKILVAVDGSFHSRVALDFTAQNVLRHPRTSLLCPPSLQPDQT